MSFRSWRSAQWIATTLSALLLIDDLRREGLIDGGNFTVERANAEAEFAIVAALNEVSRPTREEVADRAIGLMTVTVAGGVDPGDLRMMRDLMLMREVIWP